LIAEPLRKLERTLYRHAVDTGVWDIVLGTSLMAIGAAIASGMLVVVTFVAAAVFPIGHTYAQRTARRLGYVLFGAERRRRLRHASVCVPIGAVLLVAMLSVGGTGLPDLVKAGIVVAAPLSLAAALFEIRRFHAYAAIIIGTTGGVLITGSRSELALILAGMAIFACGVVVLRRFLCSCPAGPETARG
jgi:hypothetical protein